MYCIPFRPMMNLSSDEGDRHEASEMLLPIPTAPARWYEVDGRKIFEIRDKNGNVIGYIAYLIFEELPTQRDLENE